MNDLSPYELPGWTGHIIEQLKDNKIFRPSSEYVGAPVGQKVIPLAER
jgi:citrate synthase